MNSLQGGVPKKVGIEPLVLAPKIDRVALAGVAQLVYCTPESGLSTLLGLPSGYVWDNQQPRLVDTVHSNIPPVLHTTTSSVVAETERHGFE